MDCWLLARDWLYNVLPRTTLTMASSNKMNPLLKQRNYRAPTGVAQWTKCQPVNRKVTGSIPSQSTCLGHRPGPQWGAHERQPHSDVSLPFSLPSPLSENK